MPAAARPAALPKLPRRRAANAQAASSVPRGGKRKPRTAGTKARPPGLLERHRFAILAGALGATLAALLLYGAGAWLVERIAGPTGFAAMPSAAAIERLLLPVERAGRGLAPSRLADALPPPVSRPPAPEVRHAIRHAARSLGVDEGFLLAVAARESSFDPTARAATSSAVGLYQFTEDTWLRVVKAFGPRHGLARHAARIAIDDESGTVALADAKARAALLRLRDDPRLSALLAAELAVDNAARLQRLLGRPVAPAETYIAHFLGVGQAAQAIRAAESSPGAAAARLFPTAASRNPGVFRPRALGGGDASVAELVGLIRLWFDREAPRLARL
jgi:Transglycosylase SLT domain